MGKRILYPVMKRPNKKELQKLFDCQCSPCIEGFPECKGDKDKAKKWRCPNFISGFTILEV